MSNFWDIAPPTKILGTQFTLKGYSWAAKNTCFYIPELKIMLDAGLEHEYIPDHVFITHCHSDHSKNLPQSVIQLGNIKSKETKKVNIYVPEEMVDKVRSYIDAFYVMSKNNPKHKVHSKYNLIGVKANTRIEVMIRNTKYIVEVIKCYHTVPCVGYGFIEIRKRLKPEYVGKEGYELAALKKEGIAIMEEYEHPQFCYLGDSNEWVFTSKDTSHFFEKYNFIMTECTFITSDQKDQAHHKKHILIDNLEPIIRANPDKTYVLYHFSDRYTKDEIVTYFKDKDYKNIIIWV
ncbi:ribonuclease Z/metallo-beta-lactamase domain protein [Fadolivirus algeromassiliense]|jgi:ribonuclease Z|uniref:Ribonuclease Z/metallo-beta-lactamase domain protein n=1 Tax=Fadolivirus FV1/VV64 TaxID=3070911 RepID=A0A7D3USP4_9VIRU|nr:ribonuclease Z/metallo-beta-lactamase domain protein [Fadolivirus algeromassiliense]QKF93690.1 ribonuclease Z/metallo-beta-lactamase domain protein [Fadolivirus FV1/VV64]